MEESRLTRGTGAGLISSLLTLYLCASAASAQPGMLQTVQSRPSDAAKIEYFQQSYEGARDNARFKEFVRDAAPMLAAESALPPRVRANLSYLLAEAKSKTFDYDGVENLYHAARANIGDKGLEAKIDYKIAEEAWFTGRYALALERFIAFVFEHAESERRILLDLALIEAIPTNLDALLKEEEGETDGIGLYIRELVIGEQKENPGNVYAARFLLSELAWFEKDFEAANSLQLGLSELAKVPIKWQTRFAAQRLYNQQLNFSTPYEIPDLSDFLEERAADLPAAARAIEIAALRLASNAESVKAYRLLHKLVESQAYKSLQSEGGISERVDTQIRFNHAILSSYANGYATCARLLLELIDESVEKNGSLLDCPPAVQHAFAASVFSGDLPASNENLQKLEIIVERTPHAEVQAEALLAHMAVCRRKGLSESLSPMAERFLEIRQQRSGDMDFAKDGMLMSRLLQDPGLHM